MSAQSADHFNDPTQFSLEQLVSLEVYSASKYKQRSSDAPASISVLRAEDFKTYGWRGIDDMLRSVRGMYVSSDRVYSYAGIQGFSPPGDYNMRLLVLLDGYRLNENIFDSGFVGSEFILDIDLIDRVEVVRGPGASVYGGNALFGVINIITKKGENIQGREIGLSLGSHNDRAGRATLGATLENGADLLLSASARNAVGPNLYFADLNTPDNNNGYAQNTDYTRQQSFFAKLSGDNITFEAAHSSRKKGLPSGALGTLLNDPASYYLDEQTFVSLKGERELGNGLNASTHLYYGHYAYQGDFNYAGNINRDIADGRWWGIETKLLQRLNQQHLLVYGLEYQNNTRQTQRNFDLTPYVEYLDSQRHSQRFGAYLQDEITWNEAWGMTLGGRFDRASGDQGTLSPRLGLIYRQNPSINWKLLYGSAFRSPNAYERYYDYRGPGTQQLANPTLSSEKIKTYQVIMEKSLPGAWRLTAEAYYYRMTNLIGQTYNVSSDALQYQNSPPVAVRGTALEIERNWDGYRLRASYSLQFARDDNGARPANSPTHLGKANFSAPLPGDWRIGYEWQYTGARLSTTTELPATQISNLTLSHSPRGGNREYFLSIYNLFNKQLADPASFDPSIPDRQALPQNERQLRLNGVFRF